MMIRRIASFASIVLALSTLIACGGGGGDDGDDDAPADAPDNVPAMITVSGNARSLSAGGAMPVEGAVVAAFLNADENTAIAMTTTDAQGNYMLTAPTNGKAIDGFIKATKAGLLDTYLYAPAPLVADFGNGSINMVSQGTFDLLATLCQGNQDPAKGTVAVAVSDAAMMSVAGAIAESTPAATKYCYNGSNGLPSGSATMTEADGVAYMFNVTGTVTVGATKAGSTFKSHMVKARPGTLTTTPIVP